MKGRGYNLDFKNPHAVETDHGDPEELLAKLNAAEGQKANTLRDQLKFHFGRGVAAMDPDVAVKSFRPS